MKNRPREEEYAHSASIGNDMNIICDRPECQTSAGCAHRGPRGEYCWITGDPFEPSVIILILSKEDWERFAASINDPPAPSEKLIELARRKPVWERRGR